MKQDTTAYIGLGSNMGNRCENIRRALALMGESTGIEVKNVSSLNETDPVGGPPQGKYLNAVAEITTELDAAKLLKYLQKTEKNLGRIRRVHWGPRTIDLDILLYGEQVIETANLQVPHPRMHERLFVLEPLREIAPGAWHPTLKKTVGELCDRGTGPESGS